MKKRDWILLLLSAACLAGFFRYIAVKARQTDGPAPVIIVPEGRWEASVLASRDALTAGVTALDETDGDVSGSLVVETVRLTGSDGRACVTLAAFDRAGNVAKATRSVLFTDYRSPRFTLSAPLVYPYGSRFDVLANLSAQDLVDGDIQHRIRASSPESASIDTLGIHPVQFRVTNSLGDTVSLVLDVEVCPANAYNAKLTLKEYLVYLPKGSAFWPEDYPDCFVCPEKTVDLSASIPENITVTTSGHVDTGLPGVYTVSYTVTDSEKQRTGFSKLIVVVEG